MIYDLGKELDDEIDGMRSLGGMDEYEAMVREHFPNLPRHVIETYGWKGFMWLPADVKTRIANGLSDGLSCGFDDFPGE